jgi:hypothetical protein
MDEGHYEIYLDGLLYTEGKNFSKSKPIAGEGIFIIGQEQDNVGGERPSSYFKNIDINLGR